MGSTRPPRPPAQQQRPNNKLIACLPQDDYSRLKPHMKTIPLKKKQIIHRFNEPVGKSFSRMAAWPR